MERRSYADVVRASTSIKPKVISNATHHNNINHKTTTTKTTNKTTGALDHNEDYFPTCPASGNKVCTLNPETDPESVVYRYGIWGDLSFFDKLPILTKDQYNSVIGKLNWKLCEIMMWAVEDDVDSDDEVSMRSVNRKREGLARRDNAVRIFIDKLIETRDRLNG